MEITEEIRAMARSIIPDTSPENTDLLEMAISYGILLERERLESVKRLERFKQTVAALSHEGK